MSILRQEWFIYSFTIILNYILTFHETFGHHFIIGTCGCLVHVGICGILIQLFCSIVILFSFRINFIVWQTEYCNITSACFVTNFPPTDFNITCTTIWDKENKCFYYNTVQHVILNNVKENRLTHFCNK